MNWGQFKDPLCYLYLHGAVISSLSLMQEVVSSRLNFYTKFVNEFTEFSENHLGKTPLTFLLSAQFKDIINWVIFWKHVALLTYEYFTPKAETYTM